MAELATALSKRGTVTINDAAALTGLNSSDGAMVYVLPLRDFVIARQSIATVDNITAWQHASPSWRWERLGLAHPSWAEQLSWRVNADTGSDQNLGTPAAPLKTFAELTRRLGYVFSARRSYDVAIGSNLPGSDPIAWDVTVRNSGRVSIMGEPIQQFSGVTSNSVHISTATNVESKCTSTWNVSAEIQRLVASVGNAFAWVAKDLGANQARLSPWAILNESVGSTAPGISTVPDGAPLSTYTLPTVAGMLLSVRGTAGSSSPFLLQKINFTGAAGTGRIFAGNCRLQMQNCKVTGALRLGAGLFLLANCHFGATSLAIDYSVYFRMSSGLVTAGLFDTAGARPQQYVDIRASTMFQGVGIGLNAGGVLTHQDVWFFDVASDAMQLEGLAAYRSNGLLCGGNVSGRALAFGGGTRGVYTQNSGWKLAGTAGDLRFGAANTSAPAYDVASNAYTAPRALSFANLALPVASGGFGGSIVDPTTGCSLVLGV